MASWTTRDIPDLSGRLAIVTGGTGGLGQETAWRLAGAGAEVVLAGRNPKKAQDAERLIRERCKGAKVRFEPLDLERLSSVENFATRALAAGHPINILVNNAGVMAPRKRETTPDNHEKQFQTNYLGHFALTAKLLPLLSLGKARVVQLSSIAHRSGQIKLSDLDYALGYKPFPVYSQAKLATLMFAIELARRSKAKHWNLTSVAAHPGVARTDLVANGPAVGANAFVRWGIQLGVRLVGQSTSDGALPVLMAATMPEINGGQYFGPQGWNELKGPPGPAKIEPQALDADVASKLWDSSERLSGVEFG